VASFTKRGIRHVEHRIEWQVERDVPCKDGPAWRGPILSNVIV
jgi:hypothetical protein